MPYPGGHAARSAIDDRAGDPARLLRGSLGCVARTTPNRAGLGSDLGCYPGWTSCELRGQRRGDRRSPDRVLARSHRRGPSCDDGRVRFHGVRARQRRGGRNLTSRPESHRWSAVVIDRDRSTTAVSWTLATDSERLGGACPRTLTSPSVEVHRESDGHSFAWPSSPAMCHSVEVESAHGPTGIGPSQLSPLPGVHSAGSHPARGSGTEPFGSSTRRDRRLAAVDLLGGATTSAPSHGQDRELRGRTKAAPPPQTDVSPGPIGARRCSSTKTAFA